MNKNLELQRIRRVFNDLSPDFTKVPAPSLRNNSLPNLKPILSQNQIQARALDLMTIQRNRRNKWLKPMPKTLDSPSLKKVSPDLRMLNSRGGSFQAFKPTRILGTPVDNRQVITEFSASPKSNYDPSDDKRHRMNGIDKLIARIEKETKTQNTKRIIAVQKYEQRLASQKAHRLIRYSLPLHLKKDENGKNAYRTYQKSVDERTNKDHRRMMNITSKNIKKSAKAIVSEFYY